MVNFSLAHFFEGGLKKGVEVAEAKSAEVEAEATASANDLTDKTEAYETEKAKNKMTLRENADAVKSLIGNDAGKIRTVMKTYGNVNVLAELQKDFANYQANNIAERKTGQFKSLSEYVNGRISGTGNTLLTDEAAEQVSDDATIAGDELDIQKAEKRAKGMGVSVEEYLENQAKKMTVRPAFDIDKRAARLVEQSKMGAFGTTLTLEEAKKQITKDKITPDEAEELEDSGYAMERDGGLSTEQRLKTMALVRQTEEAKEIGVTKLNTLRTQLTRNLPSGTITLKDGVAMPNEKTNAALINKIKSDLEGFKRKPNDNVNNIKIYEKLLETVINETKEVNTDSIKNEKKTTLNNKEINHVKLLKSKYKQTDEQIAQSLVKSYKGKITLEEALKMVKGL